MELEQHRAVVAEAVGAVDELLGELAAEEAAGPLDVLDAHWCHRRGHVQAALGLSAPGPAAGAWVLARGDGPGARPAADRRVATVGERVGRQQLDRRVVLHLGVGPGGDGVDLGHATQQVGVHDRCRRPRGGVGAAQPGDPRRLAGEGPFERLDLARLAARFGVGRPLVDDGACRRLEDPHAQVEVATQALGVPLGLGEEVPGVEEHDIGFGDRPADEVDEHRVGEAGGDDQAVTELGAGPAEHLEGMRVLEHLPQSIKSRVSSSTF